MSTTTDKTDPRQVAPKPPFEEARQSPPGSEEAMRTKPDHGEQTYVGTGKLRGRRALITGGDSGIGRAVALSFAREGADVCFSFLSEENDARETESLLAREGHKVFSVRGDLATQHHCEELAKKTVNGLGGLDILVNNAAFQMEHETIEELTPEEWDYTFRTNIYSMFFLCRAAWSHFQPGASIINTASVQAYQPSPKLLAYASTKGAIVTFTKSLSDLGIKKGVRVNAVAPGPVWTPLIPATMSPDHVKEFGKSTQMGRPAQPAELAPTYVFLASNESRFVTGAVLDLTGGKMLP
ncbi:MAG: SDR family oxidoreductase [Acidobacteriaceae bacterium]|nr:SDR family oxidoreductase [Acidobacteriaceae bacterium]